MVKSKPKKNTSIDDLAVMVRGGFSEMNDRFEAVDNRIDKLEKNMNQRFDRIENILIVGHDRRIEILEDKVLRLAVATKVKFN